jgi:hypothetical protein
MIEEITLGLHRYSYLLQQASPPLWSDLTRHHGSPALLALQPPERKLRRCGHPTARISRSSNLKRLERTSWSLRPLDKDTCHVGFTNQS